MALTPAQLPALKAAILAEVNPAFVVARTNGQTPLMTEFYNADASPAWYVWRTTTPTTDIAAAVSWANFTPTDTPDATTLYTNRALLCALKRDNLRTLLDRDSLPTDKANTRQALTDALQNVPAGAAGALLDAGWLGADKVKTAISRGVTRGERLFVTGTGTAGTPGSLGFEGAITDADIGAALES